MSVIQHDCIDIKNLSRLFSHSTIRNALKFNDLENIKQLLSETGYSKPSKSTILLDVYKDIYSRMLTSYRNEYIYKTAIIDQILLGHHTLEESFLVTEFNADNCKADIVIFNGTSTVYEIKTELDTFNRLERQISAYKKVFDRINIITSEKQLKKLKGIVDDTIGILVLNDENVIITEQNSKSNKLNTDPSTIFDSLRKSEYSNIINDLYQVKPNIPNTEYYDFMKEIFLNIDPIEAHDAMVKEIKKRGTKLKHFIEKTPFPMKAFSISSKLTKKQQTDFLEILNQAV